MKYGCMYIDKGITFFYDAVRMCCKSAHNNKGMPFLSDYEKYNIDDIFNKKREYKKLLYNGTVPDECKGCIFLKEIENISQDDYISIIDIDSFNICNSKCIYCGIPGAETIDRNVFPIIKDLFKKKLIKDDKYGYIQFAGGEPTIMKNFENILDLCMKNGISNYMIHTNGIKYSKSIEKLLKNYDIKLIISLDSADKETFLKVKQVPCFDNVVKNIKKYVQAQKKSDISVRSKYIIIPGVNDSKEEILKWYDLSVSLGVKMLILDVEMQWFKMHNQTITKETEDIIKLIQDKCSQDNIVLDYYESLKVWFNNKNVT